MNFQAKISVKKIRKMKKLLTFNCIFHPKKKVEKSHSLRPKLFKLNKIAKKNLMIALKKSRIIKN